MSTTSDKHICNTEWRSHGWMRLWDQVTHGQAPHWCIHPRHREELNSIWKTADRCSRGLSCKNIISLLFLFIKESRQWMLHHTTAESLTFTCNINTKGTNPLQRIVMSSKVRQAFVRQISYDMTRSFSGVGKHLKGRCNMNYTTSRSFEGQFGTMARFTFKVCAVCQ